MYSLYTHIRSYLKKHETKEGVRIEMQVHLRSEDKSERFFYFFFDNAWEKQFFSGLPRSVIFADYILFFSMFLCYLISNYLFLFNLFFFLCVKGRLWKFRKLCRILRILRIGRTKCENNRAERRI